MGVLEEAFTCGLAVIKDKFAWWKFLAAFVGAVVGAIASLSRWTHIPVWVDVPLVLALVAAIFLIGFVRMVEARDAEIARLRSALPQVIGGAGGSGYNAGGGGGAAGGPGGYAAGGQGGGSPLSLFDTFGRVSYETGRSVREIAESAGIKPSQMSYEYGRGGDGGGSGPSGPEDGQQSV